MEDSQAAVFLLIGMLMEVFLVGAVEIKPKQYDNKTRGTKGSRDVKKFHQDFCVQGWDGPMLNAEGRMHGRE